jgi:Tol biopolymer transport system component
MRRFAVCVILYTLLGASALGSLAAPPIIQEVRVDRGMDTNSWGMTFYHDRLSVTVSATEPETVACVVINDPSGRQWAISVCAGGGWSDDPNWWMLAPDMGDLNWWITEDADHTVRLGMYDFDLPTAPPAGTYRIRVNYNTSDTPVELVTPPVPAIDSAIATIVAPLPDSIVGDTTPTLRWTNGAPGAQNTLLVREEGYTPWSGWPADDAGAIWSADVGSATQATYNFDGTALRPELEPGRSYFWRVESWFPEDDFVTDHKVSIWTSQIANGRFTINTTWPDLPDLPGKICYGGPMWGDWGYDPDSYSMWLYSTDLANRKWLGPETAVPGDWSPDGVKLLYHPNDKGAWIDPGDGSLPYRIPNIAPWGDTRWSPDGTQLVYKETKQDGVSPSEIRIANIDGTNVRAIASSFETEPRYPSWSPQGDWIVYVDDADPGGQGIWLVRPGGTERHAVIATEIAGYPDVELDGINEPNWSPDGASLAVSFSAGFAGWGDADALWGIGVISRNGGALRPVFVAPPGYACCAAPRIPVWSPTGTKIAFTSAHHMPPNPDWYNTYTFEPGSEIWLIDADGSGEPVRLTYDFIFDWVGSWWAPPTFTDVERGFWAVSAINACYESGIVAGYPEGDYKPASPVTRDQMAVYIARALAGGDSNVPDFTDTPTFPDAPEDNWALDYIEYAVDQGVVTGYDDGNYHPEYEVTRDQMAVYVARALVAPTGEAGLADYLPSDPRNFPDVPDTFWAYKHIEYCVEHGVVQGYDDGYYHPEITVTRDQMAVYVARAFGL